VRKADTYTSVLAVLLGRADSTAYGVRTAVAKLAPTAENAVNLSMLIVVVSLSPSQTIACP
jgi:hypothetical protein